MDDVLQALAKMLNMTTDEVSSLLSTFKGNAPQIYETLLKEKMMYDVFNFLQFVFLPLVIISVCILIMSTLEYFGCHGDYVYSWEYEDREELKEIKARKKEKKKKVGRLVKLVFITTCTNGFLYITFSVLKIILTPNYAFIVNEVLPRLTHK
ncbi:hypothetical protein ACLNCS_04280 [Streptococcus sp. CL9.43]|uniref:hypothetical protein n=1 Tax=Streptococcus sp. CL9.43 TaxID=3392238 RepID=UPI003C7D49BE